MNQLKNWICSWGVATIQTFGLRRKAESSAVFLSHFYLHFQINVPFSCLENTLSSRSGKIPGQIEAVLPHCLLPCVDKRQCWCFSRHKQLIFPHFSHICGRRNLPGKWIFPCGSLYQLWQDSCFQVKQECLETRMVFLPENINVSFSLQN